MSERTGKTLKTDLDGVAVYALDNGGYEVERDGVVLGTVEKYLSTTEVKRGKVRASLRAKPVQRWAVHPRYVKGAGFANRSTTGLTSAKAAIAILAG